MGQESKGSKTIHSKWKMWDELMLQESSLGGDATDLKIPVFWLVSSLLSSD
jgi:hypothetical protein